MIKNKAILHHSKKLTINRPDKSTLIKKQNDNINLEKNIKIRIQEESNSYKILSNNKIDKFTLLTLQKSNNDDK